jgi:hypothetical protein
VTYQIKLPTTWKIHNMFHATLLRQYKENDVYGAILQLKERLDYVVNTS